MNQKDVMALMQCSVSGQTIDYSVANSGQMSISGTNGAYITGNAVFQAPNSLWEFWRDGYYPNIIRESYPVYIQEKAMDKGKQAFEILKALMDKKLIKVEKVSDFIEAMDTLLKTL